MRVTAYGIVNRKKIVELRKAKGLSQNELAQKVSISKKYVCYLEGNNYYNPSSSFMLKLAVFFNVPLDVLFNRDKVSIS